MGAVGGEARASTKAAVVVKAAEVGWGALVWEVGGWVRSNALRSAHTDGPFALPRSGLRGKKQRAGPGTGGQPEPGPSSFL